MLDEPTNHLDIPACEILEEALRTGFDGTLLLVSHDRQFLENVTTRLVVFEGSNVQVLPGGYREHAARRESQAPPRARPSAPAPKPREQAPDPMAELRKKQDFEDRRVAARELERRRRRLAELERAIAAAEGEITAMRGALAEDPRGDWAALAARVEQERTASRTLEGMVEEWTRLSEQLEAEDNGASAPKGTARA